MGAPRPGSTAAWRRSGALGEVAAELVEIHGQHEHRALVTAAAQRNVLDAFAGTDLGRVRAPGAELARARRVAGRPRRRRAAAGPRGRRAALPGGRDRGRPPGGPRRGGRAAPRGGPPGRRRRLPGGGARRRGAARPGAARAVRSGPLGEAVAALAAARRSRATAPGWPPPGSSWPTWRAPCATRPRVGGRPAPPGRGAGAPAPAGGAAAQVRRGPGCRHGVRRGGGGPAGRPGGRRRGGGAAGGRARRAEHGAGEAEAAVRRSRARRPANSGTGSRSAWGAGHAGARLEVRLAPEGAGEPVELWLGANVGEPVQPLARAASGGELARAMLAIRLVGLGGPQTMVFDEVDAGVGGAAALALGRGARTRSGGSPGSGRHAPGPGGVRAERRSASSSRSPAAAR